MKKVLLSMAALALTMSANAQLLTYDFETVDEEKIVAENWKDFPESSYDFSKDGVGVDGSKALYAKTDGECATYQRVVAIKNLGIQENTRYRITLQAKGTGSLNVGLLKGCFYHDKALQNDGDEIKTFEIASPDEFTKIEYSVWSPSRSIMEAAHADLKQDEYWNQDFLRLSFCNTGELVVDDVVVEEIAPVIGIIGNGQAIKISFYGATNTGALTADGPVEVDKSCVSVKIDGEAAEVNYAEIKSDGSLYAFLTEDYAITEGAEIEVSFNNVIGLKYTDSDAAIKNFTATGAFDGEFAATGTAYEEAELVSADPENDAFEIDRNINTFTFVFNKLVSSNDKENGKPEASLTGPEIEEDLEVVANDGLSNTLVFKRKSTEPLADGTYTIVLNNISNEKNVPTTTEMVLNFEVGEVAIGTIEYTAIAANWIESSAYGQAQPDNAWISYFNGAVNSTNANRTGAITTDGKGHGFYICCRGEANPAQLTYGEGNTEDSLLTLPKGDLQFRVYFTKWQDGGGNLTYTLTKKGETDPVASGALSAEGNTPGFWDAVTSIPYASFNVPGATAGNYVLTLTSNEGWGGSIVYGYEIYTYEEKGPKVDTEVIINENFASVGDGSVPAAGTGWAVYDNNNLGAKGAAQSGRNRMMAPGTCSNLTIGFYNRFLGGAYTDYYMTYGEPAPDDQVDEEGNKIEEPELLLDNAKYSFSWYAVNWKGDNNTYYFDLIDAETGEIEYSLNNGKGVQVTSTVAGKAQNADAELISFSYVPKGGKYIMKWYMTGESIIGKIKVEKMGSIAAFWKKKLVDEGLTPAKEKRASVDAEEYAGTTRDSLDNVIAKYSTTKDMHTPAVYQAAIDELVAAAKAMATRVSAISAYKTDIVKLGNELANIAGQKYENLDVVPTLQKLYNDYAEVNPSTLEDKELLSVQAQITDGATNLSSVVTVVNDLLTKQISNLLTGISTYADETENENVASWITRAEWTIEDDQEVAAELQKILTAYLYKKIAGGYNFSHYDEEFDGNVQDSIDMTGYIANNMMYTINAQKTYTGSAADAAFPGWNVTDGTVSNVWWWEGALAISATKPAVNASIRNTGSNAFKVKQDLNNLPVGNYTLTMKTADCSNIKNVSQTYEKKDESLPWSTSEVYALVGETKTATVANHGEGQVWRNAAVTTLQGIEGTTESGAYTLSMTIGADMNCTNDAAQVDDTNLYMTGKIDGFDYAKAAAALLGEVTLRVESIERQDAPVSVVYYNVNGQKSQAAKGVNLKVERYADGLTVVKKVIVK